MPPAIGETLIVRSPTSPTWARQLGFTRARVTQLMDLLLLAPEVQEEIVLLELPPEPSR